jgi:membrane associated rhomboid family serine protease
MLVLPLRDVIPSRTIPFVTIGLILANTLAFGVELTLSDRQLRAVLMTYGLVPAWPDPGSVLTSMFLHGGWAHFLGSMLFLWIFGDTIEDRMGHLRFLLFYLACGAAAGLGQTLSSPNSLVPMIGASGAIAGVIGAYFVLFPYSRVLTLVWVLRYVELVEVPALFFLGLWLALQLVLGIGTLADQGGGIAFAAQVAGFVAGLALGRTLRRPERMRVEWTE